MVFEYLDGRRAETARRALAGAGIAAAYALGRPAPAGDTPATAWPIHRVTVGTADALDAVAELDARDLLPSAADLANAPGG